MPPKSMCCGSHMPNEASTHACMHHMACLAAQLEQLSSPSPDRVHHVLDESRVLWEYSDSCLLFHIITHSACDIAPTA